jgi:hypothetical protein
MIVVVVYVDDIIFGSNLIIMSRKFATEMQEELEISMLGELSFFLGLQVTQSEKRNIYFPNQIYQGNFEEIPNGR